MKSTPQYFDITGDNIFKQKMLNWANRFSIFCFLDNSSYSFDKPSFDYMLAAGSRRSIALTPGNAYNALKKFYDENPSWLFGHLGYDLKNEVEILPPPKNDPVGFGLSFFFEPEIILQVTGNTLAVTAHAEDAVAILAAIELESPVILPAQSSEVFVKSGIDKKKYIETIDALREHIRRGDCYELNFCQHFFAENAVIDPLYVYAQLAKASPVPFAALYKKDDSFCLCASPERYLKKTGNIILSQPMKGTSKRNVDHKETDDSNRQYLIGSTKEKSENVMVVDLVRNDLSKVCMEGTVEVKELFGVYSFPQVHQMTSTITGVLKSGLHWTDAIKATFPMGSMTGAPKKRVMEFIDEYETAGRGLFSGSIGYITPYGDVDFNVVIRSIFYNSTKKYLSFFAGSGITFYSDAADEYEECLLKIKAILTALNA